MTSGSGIQVINRAAEILRQLKKDNSGSSLGAIANHTGLPRSTVQRIVNALIAEGFIATAGRDGDLRLGPEIQALAAAGRVDVVSIMRPALDALSARTGETVDLAIFAEDRMIFVDQVTGRHRLSAVSVPGEQFPLTTTANGKAVMALLPEQDVADLFTRENAQGDLSSFLSALQNVHETGIAYDLDEHTIGISAAGVAFQTASDEIFAVSIPAPTTRFKSSKDEIDAALSTFVETVIDTNSYFSRSTMTMATAPMVA